MKYPFYYNSPYRNYYQPHYPHFHNNYNKKECIPPIEKIPPKISKPNKIDYFEILGFKLYYDDLIIIGLIYLLFNEGVQDELLIISLILLIGD